MVREFIFKPKIKKGFVMGYRDDNRKKYNYLEEGDSKNDILIALANRVIKLESSLKSKGDGK